MVSSQGLISLNFYKRTDADSVFSLKRVSSDLLDLFILFYICQTCIIIIVIGPFVPV